MFGGEGVSARPPLQGLSEVKNTPTASHFVSIVLNTEVKRLWRTQRILNIYM